MTKKKRLARLDQEHKSAVQVIALNRSNKLEGKTGRYDGRELMTKYLVVSEELSARILAEYEAHQKKSNAGHPSEENKIIDIYAS